MQPSPEGKLVSDVIPLRGAKKLLAERMLQSHKSSPRVTVMGEVIVDGLIEFRNTLNDQAQTAGKTKASYTHIFIKAVAQAIASNMIMNSTISGDEIHVLSDINVGMATALPDGSLMVPVIQCADKLSLDQIIEEASRLSEATRIGEIGIKDLQGGTFTFTNVGMLPDIRWQTPLINQPQCAILASGAISKSPVVIDNEVKVGSVLTASLTFDHRIVNGFPAAQFLQDFLDLLANPSTIK